MFAFVFPVCFDRIWLNIMNCNIYLFCLTLFKWLLQQCSVAMESIQSSWVGLTLSLLSVSDYVLPVIMELERMACLPLSKISFTALSTCSFAFSMSVRMPFEQNWKCRNFPLKIVSGVSVIIISVNVLIRSISGWLNSIQNVSNWLIILSVLCVSISVLFVEFHHLC